MRRNGRYLTVNTFGLSLDEIAIESFYVDGLLSFPNDTNSATLYGNVLKENWEKQGKPIDYKRDIRLIEVIDRAQEGQRRQGHSAGFMALYCCDLFRANLPVSKNKAAFLTSEYSLRLNQPSIDDLGRTHHMGMKTGPKRILANFRELQSVCHYWAALNIVMSGRYRKRLKREHPAAGEPLINRWCRANFNYWAETIRWELMQIPSLGAESWGMQPRLFPHCTQKELSGKKFTVNPEKLRASLSHYQNPNMGPN